MKELLGDLDRWRAEGGRVALARVVRTDGSAPRGPGAAMIVHEDGRVAGSVSGGCVEGAVVLEANAVLEEGEPHLVRFGYSDDEAFAVGLSCGGTIEIFVAPALPEQFDALEADLRAERPVVLATVVSAGEDALQIGPSDDGLDHSEEAFTPVPFRYVPDVAEQLLSAAGGAVAGASLLIREDGSVLGTLGHPALDEAVVRDGLGALATGRSGLRNYGGRGERRQEAVQVFFDAFGPPPKLVIFGAVDFTAALARVGKLLGYRVVVCDARATFATAERFPMADEVVVEWPQRYLEANGAQLGPRDACCVLTHDPKFDVPAILAALETSVGYLGAMGSRRTHADRVERLRAAGLDEAGIARVRAPIGLDIGARTPEETAIAIAAEIVADQTGSEGRALRATSGPIHRRAEPAVARL